MIDRCSSDFSWLLNGLRIPFFFFFFLPPRLFSSPRSNRRLLGGVHVREYQRFRFVSEGRKRIDI